MAEDRQKIKDVKIYYEKSVQYRTVRASGAWAGITPLGEIQFTIFNDLRSLPEFVHQMVTPEGNLGEVIDKVERAGILREAEVNIVMSPEATVALIEILNQMLAQVKGLTQRPQAAAPSTAKSSEERKGE